MNKSYISFKTSLILASGLSILLMTISGVSFSSRALRSTNLVWGRGPSEASTRRSTPSTIFKVRSTSPPKSAWPGVSTMLIFTPANSTAVFLAIMVMPRSLSRSMLSMTRSTTRSLVRKMPACLSIASTSVVFPWSTWAIIAIFLISFGFILSSLSSVRLNVIYHFTILFRI